MLTQPFDGIPVVANPFLPAGVVVLVGRRPTYELFPMRLIDPPSDSELAFSFGLRVVMPSPRNFILGMDLAGGPSQTLELLGSVRWRLLLRTWSRKTWLRRQRKLDHASNVHRQKRRRELERRR